MPRNPTTNAITHGRERRGTSAAPTPKAARQPAPKRGSKVTKASKVSRASKRSTPQADLPGRQSGQRAHTAVRSPRAPASQKNQAPRAVAAAGLLWSGPKRAGPRVLLAHGAGAGMESPFLSEVANGLAARGVCVARFEFPYMTRRRAGLRSPPDRTPVLLESLRAAALAAAGSAGVERLVIGGKSMGGRMASMLADELGVRGLVCLGYPFHPPGRPDKTRVDHLASLRTPCLIVQGTRDAFGTRAEVQGYELSASIRVVWVEDGNHDLTPRRAAGFDPAAARERWLQAVADFVHSS